MDLMPFQSWTSSNLFTDCVDVSKVINIVNSNAFYILFLKTFVYIYWLHVSYV